MSNAIKSLWDLNKELAFKVEFQVELIEQSNREKAEAEAKGKQALTPEPSNGIIDWDGYQKALSKTRLCDELITGYALELVALLKAEALPEKVTSHNVLPSTPTSSQTPPKVELLTLFDYCSLCGRTTEQFSYRWKVHVGHVNRCLECGVPFKTRRRVMYGLVDGVLSGNRPRMAVL